MGVGYLIKKAISHPQPVKGWDTEQDRLALAAVVAEFGNRNIGKPLVLPTAVLEQLRNGDA